MTQWMDDASCAEVGGDFWFPEVGENPKLAKQICAACPVRELCLEYAEKNQFYDGVWGGLSPQQRLKERRNRGGERRERIPTAEVIRLHKQGYTATQIADIYGVTDRSIYRRLAAA